MVACVADLTTALAHCFNTFSKKVVYNPFCQQSQLPNFDRLRSWNTVYSVLGLRQVGATYVVAIAVSVMVGANSGPDASEPQWTKEVLMMNDGENFSFLIEQTVQRVSAYEITPDSEQSMPETTQSANEE